MKIFLIATFENFYVSVKEDKAVIHKKQFDPLTKVKGVQISENGKSEFFLVSNDGYYLCAHSNHALVASSSKLGWWEKFRIEKLSDGYLAFLSAHGKYLSTKPNGMVTANAKQITQREKFKLLTLNTSLLKLTEKSNFSPQPLPHSAKNNYFQQAMSLEKQGKLKDAINHYNLSLQQNPNFSWPNYKLARLLVKQGDLTQALEHYQKAIYLHYNHSYFHYELGLLLESIKNYHGAMSSYLNAIELNPENTHFREKYHQVFHKKSLFQVLKKFTDNEVDNSNLSKVSVDIRELDSQNIKSKDRPFYHPVVVIVSFNNEPDKPNQIVYHLGTKLNLMCPAFGRLPLLNKLFVQIVRKHPDFQGKLRLSIGDKFPENVFVNEQNKLFCFSPRKDQKFTLPIPDPAFLYAQAYSKFRKEVEQNWINWQNRKPCAFWRGSSSGNEIIANNWQNNDRIKLCILALELNEPEFLDAKITNIVQIKDECLKKTISQSGIYGQIVPQIEFIKYKYVIDIDGNVNSWPGLFTKLLTGSCVLKVDSDYYQWYYERLKPYVNYVPIQRDLEDLVEKINWCREHDDEARKIGERGRKLALSMTVASELDWAEKLILEVVNKSK